MLQVLPGGVIVLTAELANGLLEGDIPDDDQPTDRIG